MRGGDYIDKKSGRGLAGWMKWRMGSVTTVEFCWSVLKLVFLFYSGIIIISFFPRKKKVQAI